MAKLVAAFGSSHSIMLVSQREDWQHGFKVIDTKNAHYYDKQGRKTDYETLLAAMSPGTEAMPFKGPHLAEVIGCASPWPDMGKLRSGLHA